MMRRKSNPPSGMFPGDISDSMEQAVDQAGSLDAVDPSVAKYLAKSGLGDGSTSDDPIRVGKGSWSAASLKPSQTSMVLEKAVGMALGMLNSGKVGGDLGALVSGDGHILDGHHRWAATILASGKKGKVGGYLAKIPGQELLKALNILSKGLFGVRNGKPGKGSFSRFTEKNVRELITGYSEDGVGGPFPIAAQKVQDILKRSFGSVEKGIDTMSKNVKLISKSTPSWAPDRKQMPVIDPENVPKAVQVLNKGELNWQAPFSAPAAKAARSSLVRLASSLPKGSSERRVILSGLQKAARGFDRKFENAISRLVSNELEHAELNDASEAISMFIRGLEEVEDRAREAWERDQR
jgi:hypothetical protein